MKDSPSRSHSISKKFWVFFLFRKNIKTESKILAFFLLLCFCLFLRTTLFMITGDDWWRILLPDLFPFRKNFWVFFPLSEIHPNLNPRSLLSSYSPVFALFFFPNFESQIHPVKSLYPQSLIPQEKKKQKSVVSTHQSAALSKKINTLNVTTSGRSLPYSGPCLQRWIGWVEACVVTFNVLVNFVLKSISRAS